MIVTKEKNLEEDIESFLCSEAGGYYKSKDSQSLLYVEDGTYQVVDGHGYRDMPGKGIDIATLVNFVQTTQPKAWERFEKQCNSDPEKKFFKVFQDAVSLYGIVHVLDVYKRQIISRCSSIRSAAASALSSTCRTIKRSVARLSRTRHCSRSG